MKYYPLTFQANRKKLVWGTEDWTISVVPNSESVVENGCFAGENLAVLIANNPQEFLGKEVAAKYNNHLPLLAKIIDANLDLSIQVHPNDEMAMREHGKFGKSEMWYVLDAKPGAYLYAGFKQQITPEEYKERVANGTICDVLAKHEVHKDDVFYLPAGRVHAICGGIKLAEVQQSSDVTYRIYDYNRPGLDGKPRELHTELAALAIDYRVYPEYKSVHREEMDAMSEVLNTPYFSIKVVETSKSFHRNMVKYDSFIIIMNLGAECKISIRSIKSDVILPANTSCLIPAVIADYYIVPQSGSAKVLEAFINNKKSIGRIISEFFHG